jgi:hypothetical protein
MQKQGRLEEAIPYYEKALELQPLCMEALAGLAEVDRLLGRNQEDGP